MMSAVGDVRLAVGTLIESARARRREKSAKKLHRFSAQRLQKLNQRQRDSVPGPENLLLQESSASTGIRSTVPKNWRDTLRLTGATMDRVWRAYGVSRMSTIYWISNDRTFQHPFYPAHQPLFRYFLFAPLDMQLAAKQVEAIHPEVLAGQPADLLAFSELSSLETVRIIISFADLLDSQTRRTLESRFNAPVCDLYVASEFSTPIAFQCPDGQMHINCDYVRVDLHPVSPTLYSVSCTDLCNYIDPLISYSIGDIIVSDGSACSCGSALPNFLRVEGRQQAFVPPRTGEKLYARSFLDQIGLAARDIRVCVQRDQVEIKLRRGFRMTEDTRSKVDDVFSDWTLGQPFDQKPGTKCRVIVRSG